MTHLFLSDAEILKIKEYVPQAVGFYDLRRISGRNLMRREIRIRCYI